MYEAHTLVEARHDTLEKDGQAMRDNGRDARLHIWSCGFLGTIGQLAHTLADMLAEVKAGKVGGH